ncbi:MAG TPA: VOC family protein [Candidatus Binatia bacterium]
MPIDVVGLDHVVLRTKKLAEVLAFYRDKLGLPVERTVEQIGLYQLRAGSALVDIVDADVFGGAQAGPGESLYDHFCLAVRAESAEQLAAALDAAGIAHGDVAQRYGASGFGSSFYVDDPDGRTVELKIVGAPA